MCTPSVKAIDRRSVHQICSGQVVVTLSTALKELVENSLDAGATIIEIKLKNSGADCIEVVDNGSGVLPDNFAALALKHHTSKLNVFADLVGVETFGFRGEALSSLCALSDLCITTCHRSKTIGAKIEYDHDGQITSETPIARVTGTTVTLHNLFSTLPVRQKELLRNLKREYAKLIQVLQGYAVISTGVKFNCYTHSEKGKKSLVLSTNSNKEVKENISNIFGAKQLKSLMEFKQISPKPEECEEMGLDSNQLDENLIFTITGYISHCEHGSGRATTERQYLFINKRPCDLTKIIRMINEVYHMYNRNQYPFLVLNIMLNKDLVDINVTPDKRQVFLQQEKLLLAIIKSSLKSMYDPGSNSYEINQKSFIQMKLNGHQNSGKDVTSFAETIKNRLLSANVRKPISIMDFTKRLKAKESEVSDKLDRNDFLRNAINDDHASKDIIEIKNEKESTMSEVDTQTHLDNQATDITEVIVEDELEFDKPNPSCVAKETSKRKFDNIIEIQELSPVNKSKKIKLEQDVVCRIGNRKEVTVDFNIEKLKATMTNAHEKKIRKEQSSTARDFRATIAPENNEQAEQELKRHITKEMFKKMTILGQFNQGFIIAKSNNDLFIIDQHASDEKHNFEEQQKNTVLRSQRLIAPQSLDLTAVNEGILIDNVDIFKKNGFDFLIDPEAPVSKKVKLISLPVSRNWTFGKDDIDELIFMLSDNPGIMYRPSNVRKMFASRACRMSVMVGTALNKQQMKRIVNHMGEMEHPWNCPHGRPTMRHMVNLNMVRK